MRAVIAVLLVAALCSCERKAAENKGTDKTGDKAGGDKAAAGKVTLPSGVAYEDLVVGTGTEVKAGDTVLSHATGWLTDGTKFWSSHDGANQPVPFKLANPGVIAGWVMGVPGMKPGGKRKIWIPSQHAYGAAGRGATIPPNSDLVFEVEVIKIQ